MKLSNPPTVAELNEIQARWMAFDSNSGKAETQAMCDLMAKCPQVHLSVSGDKQTAMVIVQGGPVWAIGRPTAQAVEYVKALQYSNKRTDVAWCGKLAMWVTL